MRITPPDSYYETHEVRDTHDGVEGNKVHFEGTKEECLRFIRQYWPLWRKLGVTPSLWFDGKPISFVA
jgi:hypothetical protein